MLPVSARFLVLEFDSTAVIDESCDHSVGIVTLCSMSRTAYSEAFEVLKNITASVQ